MSIFMVEFIHRVWSVLLPEVPGRIHPERTSTMTDLLLAEQLFAHFPNLTLLDCHSGGRGVGPIVRYSCELHGVGETRLRSAKNHTPCRPCSDANRALRSQSNWIEVYPWLSPMESDHKNSKVCGMCPECGSWCEPFCHHLKRSGPCVDCGNRGKSLAPLLRDHDVDGSMWSSQGEGYVIRVGEFIKVGIGKASRRGKANGVPIVSLSGQRLSVALWENSVLNSTCDYRPTEKEARAVIKVAGWTEVRFDDPYVWACINDLAAHNGLDYQPMSCASW